MDNKTPEPQKSAGPQVPHVENYSQAKRLAHRLFGPMVRISSVLDDEGRKAHRLYTVDTNGRALVYLRDHHDREYTALLQGALDEVVAYEKSMTAANKASGDDRALVLPPGIVVERRPDCLRWLRDHLRQFLTSFSTVEERANAFAGVEALRPHEVFEARDLAVESVQGALADREPAMKALNKLLNDSLEAQR